MRGKTHPEANPKTNQFLETNAGEGIDLSHKNFGLRDCGGEITTIYWGI
jgi:hypothetical protein